LNFPENINLLKLYEYKETFSYIKFVLLKKSDVYYFHQNKGVMIISTSICFLEQNFLNLHAKCSRRKKMYKLLFTVMAIFLANYIIADGTQPYGSGTQSAPYQISMLDNLLWLSTNSSSWDKYFIQTQDVDAAETTGWNSGAGFLPISIFGGSYDGCGYKIDSLFINRPTSDYTGLFGQVNNNTIPDNEIKNLGLTNVNITGNYNVGPLIGEV